MKRFKKYLIIPAIIVIAVSILSGFSDPATEELTKKFLKDRTRILQQVFYGQISVSDAENKLASFETYPLLADDIKSIRAWENTELDLVRSMQIESLVQEKNLLSYLTYKTVIYWDMSGLSENYTLRGEYYIVLKKDNGSFKLSIFDPI